MDEPSLLEEPICVFTLNGENVDISDGYVGDNDGRKKVQLFCLSAEGDYNEISSEDATDVIKTAMICGRKKFMYACMKKKQKSSGHKRKIRSSEVESENTDCSITPKKLANNSTMLRLDTDNDVDHIMGSKQVFYSVSKTRLFSNWYLKNKSVDEILMFKYDKKNFMKVLYSFNPIVKLDKINPKDYINGNNSKYKSTFLKLIGLEKSMDSQISDSETEISDAVLSDVERNDKNSEKNDQNSERSDQNSDRETNEKKSERSEKHSESNKKNSKSNDDFTFQSWITKKNPTKMLLTKRYKKPDQDYKSSPKPRANYTLEEDKFILKWVLKNENSKMVNGNTIWKDLQRKDLPCERTWQSLRNRYLKNILCNLRDYGLSSSDEMRLKVGAEKGCIKRTKFFKNSSPPRGNNKNKLTLNENNHPSTSKTSPRKIFKKIENHEDYEDSDILSDDSISYKDFKADAEKNKKRQLFTNKTFLQSTFSGDRSNS